MQRWILHIDMDSYFVSIERVQNPALEGRPVIVGGSVSSRGVVCSASYEARKFGVRSAMAIAQAKRLCPQAIFLPVNGRLYHEYTEKLTVIFHRYSPLVEMASLDEAYIDLTGTDRLMGDPRETANKLREEITTTLKIPCSMGLASNKTLAKVASKEAKPAGFVFVKPGEEEAFLRPLPIEKLPGLGPKTAAHLKTFGIKTLGELVAHGKESLKTLFGENGSYLYQRAKGMDESPVVPEHDAKSIGRSTTFMEDTNDEEFLNSMLLSQSEEVAWEMRQSGLSASTITVRYRFADFTTHTRSLTLQGPTFDEVEIYHVARHLLWKNYNKRMKLRLVGVSVSNVQEAFYQLDILDQAGREKSVKLLKAIDKARSRHGFNAVHRAEAMKHDANKDEKKPLK